MAPDQSTPENRRQARRSRYVWTLRVLGVGYALGALAALFHPNEIFYLLNVGPKVFKITEAIPEMTERFWLAPSTSALVMLSALSFLAAESPGIRGYALVHVLAKISAGAAFIYLFLDHERYFAYAFGAVTEFMLGALVAWVALWVPGKGSAPRPSSSSSSSSASISEVRPS